MAGFERADFGKIKNYPIKDRKNKVSVDEFALLEKYKSSKNILDLFPSQLKAVDLKEIALKFHEARKKGAGVIFAMGAHVIKTGCSPIVIDWMKQGKITAVAMNGAGPVHDLEIAMIGETSEDVEEEIKTGRFGMVEETAAETIKALKKYPECGFGEAIGRSINDSKMKYADESILANAAKLGIPATVHSAIGCEITHIHPESDGALIGEKSFDDFKIFTAQLKTLNGGGVYFNVGSAVILPEVFIKALSAARNLGDAIENFYTVNMDMKSHYRPTVNVVHRPVQNGGKGYDITGHHEIMLPLLYHMMESE
jgi:hypothetical protein